MKHNNTTVIIKKIIIITQLIFICEEATFLNDITIVLRGIFYNMDFFYEISLYCSCEEICTDIQYLIRTKEIIQSRYA